jgi:hypothetical protein
MTLIKPVVAGRLFIARDTKFPLKVIFTLYIGGKKTAEATGQYEGPKEWIVDNGDKWIVDALKELENTEDKLVNTVGSQTYRDYNRIINQWIGSDGHEELQEMSNLLLEIANFLDYNMLDEANVLYGKINWELLPTDDKFDALVAQTFGV